MRAKEPGEEWEDMTGFDLSAWEGIMKDLNAHIHSSNSKKKTSLKEYYYYSHLRCA